MHFLTSALYGVVSFMPRPLYPKERAPGTHWIGGWVGPRAVVEAVVKGKTPRPAGNLTQEPRSSSPPSAVSTELSRLL
jgi:hypothetical protein